MERARPPEEISPRDFFTRWVPEAVAGDESRRRRLGATDATIVFEFDGPDGGLYTVRVADGRVTGSEGDSNPSDLRVELDLATWRDLNSGRLTAPKALLQRRLRLHGDFILGLKLHLILG